MTASTGGSEGLTVTCRACKGSGAGRAMEGRGPDTYEVDIECEDCGGTGELFRAKRDDRAAITASTAAQQAGSAAIEPTEKAVDDYLATYVFETDESLYWYGVDELLVIKDAMLGFFAIKREWL